GLFRHMVERQDRETHQRHAEEVQNANHGVSYAASLMPARRVADRARTLLAISSADGMRRGSRLNFAGRAGAPTGAWREARGAVVARSVRKRLTMRSSRLWNETTTRRPSGLRILSAASRPRSNSPNSSFTWMRNAWKVRVAG